MSFDTLRNVHQALNHEPQTPNEIADKLNLNQKTVQGALLELANTQKDVRWKKVGRYRLFWKTK
jgi:predicted ArsR family transcriptional regulator